VATKQQAGAALLTVLMLSTLLLAAGGTLLLVSTMTTRTAIDSTAEMQAYYAAEAGLQATLNVLRGNVEPNAAMPAGSKINFRKAVTLSGSNLPNDGSSSPRLSGWLNYDYQPQGASQPDRVSLSPNYNSINGIALSVSLSDPDYTPAASGEPVRVRLHVTGYGPKGAVKRLELVVKRTNFDYSPQTTIMMRSSDDGTPMTFTLGDSAAKTYTGHDHSDPSVIVEAFGSTSDNDKGIQETADTKDTVEDPVAANVAFPRLPKWLQDANEARAFLKTQQDNAISQGRYFSGFSGIAGTQDSPAFTFVDGDCNLDGGAGLLIVTGNLEMVGNPSFNGLILVLGEGSINRNGGGNGDILGAITVAKFARQGNGGFLAPTFTTNGGGTSLIQYDTQSIRKALNLSGPLVIGVREY
jgi:hypothetical protein